MGLFLTEPNNNDDTLRKIVQEMKIYNGFRTRNLYPQDDRKPPVFVGSFTFGPIVFQIQC